MTISHWLYTTLRAVDGSRLLVLYSTRRSYFASLGLINLHCARSIVVRSHSTLVRSLVSLSRSLHVEGSAAEAAAFKPGMSGETESTYMTALLLLGLMPLKPLLLSLLVLAPSMLLLLLAFCMLMLPPLLVCCSCCLCRRYRH